MYLCSQTGPRRSLLAFGTFITFKLSSRSLEISDTFESVDPRTSKLEVRTVGKPPGCLNRNSPRTVHDG